MIVGAGLQQGELYRFADRTSDVITVLESVAKEASTFPEGIFVFRSLAMAYAKVGDSAGAAKAFSRATYEPMLSRLSPGMQLNTLHQAAEYHLDLGQPAIAAEYFARSSSVKPIEEWVTFSNLARAIKAWIAAGDTAQATTAFDRMEVVFDRINRAPITEPAEAFHREVLGQELEILREKLQAP
jgi:hypothetical protein